MRGNQMIPLLAAGVLLLAAPAFANDPLGLTAPEPYAPSNQCTENNAQGPSCVQIGDGDAEDGNLTLTATIAVASPVDPTFYIDTGQGDGVSGIWQETNKVAGLQKEAFFNGQVWTQPDTELTP